MLLVSAHWGPNWGYRPSPRHPPFARALIDAGADIVYGHSCHVFQGIEIYRGKPILYSTGDFVDDYAVDPKEGNDRSFIFVVDVAGHAVRGLRLYPTTIAHMQARRARGSEAEAIAVTMIELSAELGTKAQWEPEVETLHVPVV
ncbi:MAG: CapA family protein [Thermoleophilia bacterium]|nr:CapA family protein [Thermoleophilia bacterium]